MKRADVLEYLELHAQAAIAEKRLTELRAILKPLLAEGEVSPADLPYLLTLRTQERTQPDYRSPLYRLLKRTIGKVRADKRIAAIEAAFGCITVEQLCVTQNQAYAQNLTESSAA
jgi:hypothetical protein